MVLTGDANRLNKKNDDASSRWCAASRRSSRQQGVPQHLGQEQRLLGSTNDWFEKDSYPRYDMLEVSQSHRTSHDAQAPRNRLDDTRVFAILLYSILSDTLEMIDFAYE